MYTPIQRVERMQVSLINDSRFSALAGIFMLGNTEVRDDVPTAYTDGVNTVYGAKFIESLEDAEIRGLIYHEKGGHILYRHLSTWLHLSKINASLANKAMDYVINLQIKDFNDPTFIRLPACGLVDERFRGMDAGQVFRILEAEGDDGADYSFDEHDWDTAEAMPKDEANAVKREIDAAVRQGAMVAGMLGHTMDRSIAELLAPTVDAREALRDFMNIACAGDGMSTWRKVSRRWLSQGIYMASRYSESVGSLLFGVDTSGSVTSKALRVALSELVGISEAIQPERVDLVYWDAAVAGHEVYGRDNLSAIATATKPKGGGGTRPQCVVDYIAKHNLTPQCVVMITDGDVSDWGTGWTCPVLWLVTNRVVAPIGVTIHIPNDWC
jgi:predicted metal-dependent peptidase